MERFNLAQQPAAFVDHASVKQALADKGQAALPLIMMNGAVKSDRHYPTREQLADWAGVTKPAPDVVATPTGGCCSPQTMPLEFKKSKCC